jgi:hypothetical protein
VDAAIRGDFEDGIAVLVHNKDVAGIVGHGEVRAGERGVGGVTALKFRLPVIRPVHAGVAAAGIAVARDGMQQAVGEHEVCKGQGGVGGDVYRQQTQEGIARGGGESTRSAGIGGVIILAGRPGELAGGGIGLSAGFHGANTTGEGIGPANLPDKFETADLKISPGGPREHRCEEQNPAYCSNCIHEWKPKIAQGWV